MTLESRFHVKVNRNGPLPEQADLGQCWLWTGARNSAGYGVIRTDDGLALAHRVALTLDGRDPGDLCARHRCDVPACVNPAHLIPGTIAENIADAVERRRYAGERNGHARLTVDEIIEIRALVDAGGTRSDIAARFGITESTVSGIGHRRSWTHVPEAA